MIVRALNPAMIAAWLEGTETIQLQDKWQWIKCEIARILFTDGPAYYYCLRNDRYSGIKDWPDSHAMQFGDVHGYGAYFSTADVSNLEKLWADMHLNLGLAFISDKELDQQEFGEAVLAMETMDGARMTNSFEPPFRMLYSDYDGTAIIYGDAIADMRQVMIEWNAIIRRASGL